MNEPAYAALAFDSALRAMLYGPPLLRVGANAPPVDGPQIAAAVRSALAVRSPQDPT